MNLISANKLKDTLANLQVTPVGKRKVDIAFNNGIEKALKSLVPDIIDSEPIIDAEPVVHARWTTGYFRDRICSNCTHPSNNVDDFAFAYCPHCGAKMDLEGK